MCDSEDDLGFSFHVLKGGSIQILRHGRLAMTVGGRDAARLERKLAGLAGREQQLLLARASGQYKFGNEKAGKDRR